MSRIVLSEAAQIDRREITAYTMEHFGIGQALPLPHNYPLDNHGPLALPIPRR